MSLARRIRAEGGKATVRDIIGGALFTRDLEQHVYKSDEGRDSGRWPRWDVDWMGGTL